ncbi:MAG TPA: ATP-binding protein [Gemmataceae bacterium]|nr:ATP-binding protein [Gemmataceae bacterium]
MVHRQREYDGDLRQLGSMRAFLREVCQECWHGEPADEKLIHRLALALTEAASNIILHSFEGQQHKSITMTVAADDNQVDVTFMHTGKPFDPESAAEPVFDGSRQGGFGVYLIRKCVDEVQYGQDDQGRCVMHLVQKRKQSHKGVSHEAQG